MKLKSISVIIITLFISLLFSFVLNAYIFEYNSPQLREKPAEYIATEIKLFLNLHLNKDFIAEQKATEKKAEELQKKADYIAPGIKSAHETNVSYQSYELDKIQWKPIDYADQSKETQQVYVSQDLGIPLTVPKRFSQK